jgi:hypothetical protein
MSDTPKANADESPDTELDAEDLGSVSGGAGWIHNKTFTDGAGHENENKL